MELDILPYCIPLLHLFLMVVPEQSVNAAGIFHFIGPDIPFPGSLVKELILVKHGLLIQLQLLVGPFQLCKLQLKLLLGFR